MLSILRESVLVSNLTLVVSSVHPSFMFLGDTCTRDAHEIANLFGEHFQAVYVRDDPREDFVVNDSVEDSSTVLLIQLVEETVEQGILVFFCICISLFAKTLTNNFHTFQLTNFICTCSILSMCAQ
jgi:hypothetical protein